MWKSSEFSVTYKNTALTSLLYKLQRKRIASYIQDLNVYGYKWVDLHVFSIVYTKGNNFRDFLCASLADIALRN